jgi:hypothetical protein
MGYIGLMPIPDQLRGVKPDGVDFSCPIRVNGPVSPVRFPLKSCSSLLLQLLEAEPASLPRMRF